MSAKASASLTKDRSAHCSKTAAKDEKLEEKPQQPPDGAARQLDADFVQRQRELGAQSCRGVGSPDLSPLGHDSHALKVFSEMLRRERALAGEFVVFYHSYNSPALIYELQATVARVLFRFSAKHGVLPRLLKKPFEKIPDAAAMLKEFPKWRDQDHNPAFKSVGICCSTSLAARDPEATPTQVFLHGYGASTVSIEVVRQLLQNCGTPKRYVASLAQKVMDLAVKHGLPQASRSGQQGHLLQMFIHRSCVDKWAYASHPMGVLDASRQPLSKHLAKDCKMVGQVRVVVNPSAFMRAQSVRLHAYSADAPFHRNRPRFQEDLFEVLDPILGSAEVRRTAATGIYGGKLPAWWKDLETEKIAAAAEKPDTAANVEQEDSGSKAGPIMPRTRCRYGAECRRKNADHRSEYSHPGDADWDSPTPVPIKSVRLCCRHGAQCYRKNPEHRSRYAHPGDADWDEASKVQDSQQDEPQQEKTQEDVSADSEQMDACDARPMGDEMGEEMDSSVWDEAPRACGDAIRSDDWAEATQAYPLGHSCARAANRSVAEQGSTQPVGVQVCAEYVPGLRSWLADLNLSMYADAADEWAEARGACSLDDVNSHLEEFLSTVGFKKFECQRIRRDASCVFEAATAA